MARLYAFKKVGSAPPAARTNRRSVSGLRPVVNKRFESMTPSRRRCHTADHASAMLRGDPRRFATEGVRSKVWIGYLEHGVQKHSDKMPSYIEDGAIFQTQHQYGWDRMAPAVPFTVTTACFNGRIRTLVHMPGESASSLLSP